MPAGCCQLCCSLGGMNLRKEMGSLHPSCNKALKTRRTPPTHGLRGHYTLLGFNPQRE